MNKKLKNVFANPFQPIKKVYHEIIDRENLKEQNKNVKSLSVEAKILIGSFMLFLLAIALMLGAFGIDLLAFPSFSSDDSQKDNSKKIMDNTSSSEISEKKEEIQKSNKKSLTISL